MTPEARKMLDVLDAFLATHGRPSQEVATILSAIRGDDTEKNSKSASTAKIRRAAFPLCAKNGDNFHNPNCGVTLIGSRMCWNMMTHGSRETLSLRDPYSHAGIHLSMAAEVLGFGVVIDGKV